MQLDVIPRAGFARGICFILELSQKADSPREKYSEGRKSSLRPE